MQSNGAESLIGFLARVFAWIALIVLAIIASFLIFVFVISVVGAPSTAEENAKQRSALLKAAEFVSSYREQYGRFPARAVFEREADRLGGSLFTLHTSRPTDENYRFPDWSAPEQAFAISD